jgi:hypothetical protein
MHLFYFYATCGFGFNGSIRILESFFLYTLKWRATLTLVLEHYGPPIVIYARPSKFTSGLVVANTFIVYKATKPTRVLVIPNSLIL